MVFEEFNTEVGIYFKSTHKTERIRNKMNVKALLVFLVLIVVSFATESEAYGGNFPSGKRKKNSKKTGV